MSINYFQAQAAKTQRHGHVLVDAALEEPHDGLLAMLPRDDQYLGRVPAAFCVFPMPALPCTSSQGCGRESSRNELRSSDHHNHIATVGPAVVECRAIHRHQLDRIAPPVVQRTCRRAPQCQNDSPFQHFVGRYYGDTFHRSEASARLRAAMLLRKICQSAARIAKNRAQEFADKIKMPIFAGSKCAPSHRTVMEGGMEREKIL